MEELFEESELPEEQARMIIEGSAYYDIEGEDGIWYRILCEYGDLIIIPPGKMHRFTTTTKVIKQAIIFFFDENDNIITVVGKRNFFFGFLYLNISTSWGCS